MHQMPIKLKITEEKSETKWRAISIKGKNIFNTLIKTEDFCLEDGNVD